MRIPYPHTALGLVVILVGSALSAFCRTELERCMVLGDVLIP